MDTRNIRDYLNETQDEWDEIDVELLRAEWASEVGLWDDPDA